MSKKPVKKSDNNKGWMKPHRDRMLKIAPEYHLIVSEGEKTEPHYFEGLKNEINARYSDRINIEINGIGQGANTLTLLDRAIQIVEKNPDKFQHVWLVYDKDDFPADDFDNTYYKCKSLSNDMIKYHALWSNECIEFWFLLHYMYLTSAIRRKEYYPKLSECLGVKYRKNSKKIYEQLKPNLKTAITNAHKIINDAGNAAPSQCAPGTAVYEIFEKLEGYLLP